MLSKVTEQELDAQLFNKIQGSSSGLHDIRGQVMDILMRLATAGIAGESTSSNMFIETFKNPEDIIVLHGYLNVEERRVEV